MIIETIEEGHMQKYFINGRCVAVVKNDGTICLPDDTDVHIKPGKPMDPSALSQVVAEGRKAGTIEERDGSGRRLLRRR